MSGKGDAPRNCFSQDYRQNFEEINWGKPEGITIMINGRSVTVHKNTLSYREIIELSGKTYYPDVIISITYSRALQPKTEGIVSPNGSVMVTNGTIICAVFTGGA